MQAGVRVPRDLKALLELEVQHEVVRAVLDGRADVGFIRDGLLERMIADGELATDALKVINERMLPQHPYRLSTRLYPEWPVFALPHVEETAVRHIAAALYALEPDHPAALAAGIHGYTVASDYRLVEELAQALRLPPYADTPHFTWLDVWDRYGYVGVALGFAMGASVLLGVMLALRNRRLKRQHMALELAASVFSHAREGIMITDAQGYIVDVNDTFSEITGYSRDDAIGQKPSLLRSGRHDDTFYRAMWQRLVHEGHWYEEVWNRRKNGDVYPEQLTISTVRTPEGLARHYVALFSDTTEQKQNEHQLRRIAHYDALTSLPNRVLLADRLEQAMIVARRRQSMLALLCIDLDGFKAINDEHGHAVGDRVLVAVAERMRSALRDSDTVARLGGDEFVAVLPDVGDHAAAMALVRRLLVGIAQPLELDGCSLVVSGSIGLSYYPQVEDVGADQLLRQADQAMYQAKLAGKNRCHAFDAEQDRSLRGHHEELERMRQALLNNEFVLFFQPRVDMQSGRVSSVEALIRWQHPERGLLLPVEFLPLVEQHELDLQIGDWVLAQALDQLLEWQQQGVVSRVSVNVSAHQLQQGDFISKLQQALADRPGLLPDSLELEVLETSALADIERVAMVMSQCEALGVGFALDDFGTGYSSLTYLRRLPASVIKIDRSFVRDMTFDPEDLAILEGVIGLATAFRRIVIAEGVETVDQGELLIRLGCRAGQGYGIGKPMAKTDLMRWIESWTLPARWRCASTVSRESHAVLYAGAEHRAWIARLHASLIGQADCPPPMDVHQCRFGRWFDSMFAETGREDLMRPIDLAHREVHEQANRLIRRRSLMSADEIEREMVQLGQASERLLELLEEWISS